LTASLEKEIDKLKEMDQGQGDEQVAQTPTDDGKSRYSVFYHIYRG